MKVRPPPAPPPKLKLVRKRNVSNVIHVKSQTAAPVTAFVHAGDIGDIIYALPTIKYLGGGMLFIEASAISREVMTPGRIAIIRDLLLAQPYISGVHPWNGEPIKYNLNKFRIALTEEERSGRFRKSMGLGERMCEAHDVPTSVMKERWLTVPDVDEVAPVIFARSARYHNPNFPWREVYDRYGKAAVFVGLPEEHEAFCQAVGPVDHYRTTDLLQVAKAIAGARLFVGNQSSPYAVAEGLKQNAILEVWTGGPNCLFYRENCWPVMHHNARLPDLRMLLNAYPTEFDQVL